ADKVKRPRDTFMIANDIEDSEDEEDLQWSPPRSSFITGDFIATEVQVIDVTALTTFEESEHKILPAPVPDVNTTVLKTVPISVATVTTVAAEPLPLPEDVAPCS